MTTWEYKTLHRQRALDPDPKTPWVGVKGWEPADLEAELAKLGAEGWELVSVTPRSSLGGWSIADSARSHPDPAGMTTSELFLFKRPKP